MKIIVCSFILRILENINLVEIRFSLDSANQLQAVKTDPYVDSTFTYCNYLIYTYA